MNREIKFRAWDKEEKIMCYQEKGVGSFFEIGGSYLEELFYNDDVVVMQYTGLKDRNGKEIYEGDIVRQTLPATGTISTAEIIYSRGRFCLDNGTIPDDLIPEACEVIGNIYENPELIK